MQRADVRALCAAPEKRARAQVACLALLTKRRLLL
jgi:hypothetical protein